MLQCTSMHLLGCRLLTAAVQGLRSVDRLDKPAVRPAEAMSSVGPNLWIQRDSCLSVSSFCHKAVHRQQEAWQGKPGRAANLTLLCCLHWHSNAVYLPSQKFCQGLAFHLPFDFNVCAD